MNCTFCARVAVVLLLGALVLPAAGCSSGSANPPPKTYAVKGKVLSLKTGPLTGGSVQFESTGKTPVSVLGEIKSDGSFTVVTLHENQKLDGAPEGSYRISVVPPQTEMQASAIVVEKVFEVKADGTNDFKIEVP